MTKTVSGSAMKFSVDIEVVGERCRRKDEPRQPRGYDASSMSRAPSPSYGTEQRPGTPEDELSSERLAPGQRPATEKPNGIHTSGKRRRPASVTNRAYLSPSSSWRHTHFYDREKSVLGGQDDDRGLVSRGEVGMKVRISYIDQKGRVNATPRSVGLGRAFSTMASDREQQVSANKPHPDCDPGDELCGWGSTVSITSLVDRLYPRRAASAKDKAFLSVLDRRYYSEDFGGHPHSHSSCAEEDLLNRASSSTPMPSIQASRAQTLTGCSSPSSSNGSHSTSTSKSHTINASHSAVPRMTTSNIKCTTDPPTTNSSGIHSRTAAVSNPGVNYSKFSRCVTANGRHSSARTNGIDPAVGVPVANGQCADHPRSEGLRTRPLTTSATKHVHFSVQDSVKERLRNAYLQRRVHSATGRWRWSGGSDGATSSRLRRRRKQTVQQPKEVVKDENAGPPVSRVSDSE